MIVTTVIREVGPILHLAPRFVGSVVLPVGGALGGVAKDLDGVLHTALNVNFCTREKQHKGKPQFDHNCFLLFPLFFCDLLCLYCTSKAVVLI